MKLLLDTLKRLRSDWLELSGLQTIRQYTAILSSDMKQLVHVNSSILHQLIKSNNSRYSDPKRLLASGRKHFSQNDEDGIIEEIFARIGDTNRFFVEFGCGNGTENNSIYLLLKGWQGCWIDGDPRLIESASQSMSSYVNSANLTLKQAILTVDNIASIFQSLNVPQDLDLLSIDVDGNDYHLWKALAQFRPRVLVIEYNAFLGPKSDAVMHYDPNYVWDFSTRYGASLHAFERLGRSLGYCLVGCTFSGVNAFFVREDLAKEWFHAPYTAENHYEPYRHVASNAPYRTCINHYYKAGDNS